MADYDYLDKAKATGEGTILGQSSSSLIGFWGIQPVNQPDALTAAVSTLTYTTATTFTTSIYVSSVSTVSAVGFVTTAEFGGVCNAVKNAQIRIAEVQARLAEAGIIAGGTAVTSATATEFEIVGKGEDDGTILGHYTSSKVGLWGITPCDQPAACTTPLAVLSIAATSTVGLMDTTISVGVTGAYGLGTAETINMAHSFIGMIANVQTRLAEIETNLAEVGLIAGGTAVTSANGDYDYLDSGNSDGTIFGYSSTQKIAFWAGTPCDQPATLTTAMATISFVSAVAATYVITSMLIGTSTFKFVSVTAGNTLIYAVQNAQTRLNEIEAALEEVGIQAAN